MTVSLGELLLPIVEVSELAEEVNNEERSFKEQYGQEGAKLNIARSHLWSVNILKQANWVFLSNNITCYFCCCVEVQYHPQK